MTSMRRRFISGLLATALLGTSALPVLAQAEPQPLGTFQSWVAWKANDGFGTICFITSPPESSSPRQGADGKPINRDPPSFLVINREKGPVATEDGTHARDAAGNLQFQKVRHEVQALPGYPLRPTTDSFFHSATVDGKRYALRSSADVPDTPENDSEAMWLAATSDEPSFIEALKAGSKLVVGGTSNRSGLEITDTYSLAGVTAALKAIDEGCP